MFREILITTALALPFAFGSAAQAQLPAGGGPTQGQLPLKKPNILVIMGDDIGWFNLGAVRTACGTKRTPSVEPEMSVVRNRPEVAFRGRQDHFLTRN